MKRWKLCVVLLLVGFMSSVSQAETITLGSDGVGGVNVTADVPTSTWVRTDQPDVVCTDNTIFVGSLVGGDDLRGLPIHRSRDRPKEPNAGV